MPIRVTSTLRAVVSTLEATGLLARSSTVEGQKASIALPDCTGYRTP